MLASATGVMGAILIGSGGGPSVTDTLDLNQVIGYNLLAVSAVMIVRVLVLAGRSRE